MKARTAAPSAKWAAAYQHLPLPPHSCKVQIVQSETTSCLEGTYHTDADGGCFFQQSENVNSLSAELVSYNRRPSCSGTVFPIGLYLIGCHLLTKIFLNTERI